MPDECWVDNLEVTAHLLVSKDTVYGWVDMQRLPEHHARPFHFGLSQVDEWVQNYGGDLPATKSPGTPDRNTGAGYSNG